MPRASGSNPSGTGQLISDDKTHVIGAFKRSHDIGRLYQHALFGRVGVQQIDIEAVSGDFTQRG
ncbi:hypothetical protein C2L65_24135 [Paraburkholderia terrae]|uniref:Uncharacterized protein n=1 Tax=Paraburkholderia terrae TaxID=311230 RepID=A0A2I8EV73_9BURK|nr:hypothetical protein C2L65_24135 [Paraburkholderia terrae]